ncbi:unannotated protein [freshwater metagenome]|uniref:Unannotated protein n=1 Tax=freshwater metagenome TaxID=449393 RepID=A0A6J6F0Z5_9ZZZZ
MRLEPKTVDTDGVPRGLNLTRASLLASMKYPWDAGSAEADPSGRDKFGFYEDDRDVFDWVRSGVPERSLSLEATIMDFSDDVAYSVHDFEDAIVNGFIDPTLLSDSNHRDEVLHTMVSWVGHDQADSLGAAWERLTGVTGWVSSFRPQRAELARLKNLTSTLIGRFALSAVVDDTRKTLVVPAETAAEITVLKGIVSVHVMAHTARQPIYLEQRAMLISLAEHLYSHPESLDPVFSGDWTLATTPAERKRVVSDQVASLTDQSATALHERLCS